VKLATPEDAATLRLLGLLQVSTPDEGLAPMAKVILLTSVSTVFPFESCTATDAENVPVPFAWMLWLAVGCTVKASLDAVPAMIDMFDVPEVNPVRLALKVYDPAPPVPVI
jgi:hypothetical protein